MPRQKAQKRKDSESDEFDDEIENSKKQKTEESDDDQQNEIENEIALPAPLLSGRVIISGGTNWDMIGRKQLPKGVKPVGGPNLWGPHTVKSLKDKAIRSVVSGCQAAHSVVIDTEGVAYVWGRNDKAQLGLGDIERRDVPTPVETLSGLNVIAAACGKSHTLFLTEKGQVYSCGDNKMGQLGQGTAGNPVPSPSRIQYKGPPICRVACGAEFSVISDVRGNVYTFGLPEYGQLGHNTDGKYFVSSNKMAYSSENRPRKVQVFIEKTREGHVIPVHDVEAAEIACGVNHAVMIDRKKRVFTWGFGGYGRLGHSDPKDEMVPRLLKFFDGPKRGATKIACGSSFTLCVNELGCLFLWGKNRLAGEANMYPKPCSDLSGWEVRSMACCNMSVITASDESVVTWGGSPTYGELAYGPDKAKSSSTAQEAKHFDGTYIYQVAAGYGHSLFIARADSEEEKKKLDSLPEYDTPEVS